MQVPGDDPLGRAILAALMRSKNGRPESPKGQTLQGLSRQLRQGKGAAPVDRRALLRAVGQLVQAGLVEVVAAGGESLSATGSDGDVAGGVGHRGQRAPGDAARSLQGKADSLEADFLRLTPAGREAVAATKERKATQTPRPAKRPAAKAAKAAAGGSPGARVRAGAPLAQRVEILEARVASLLERIEQLEAWQRSVLGRSGEALFAGTEGAAGDAGRDAGAARLSPPGGAPQTPRAPALEEFRQWLLSALDRLDRENRQLGLVPVPQVRRALRDRVSDADFDRMVVELAARGEVSLVPHDRPSALSREDREACIRDPAIGQLFYWFRWRM